MLPSLRHVGIVVSDIVASKDLFTDIFNFKISSEEIESGPFIDHLIGRQNCSIKVVKMNDTENNVVELIQLQDRQELRSAISTLSLGITHVAINVERIHDIIAKLEAKGCSVINIPRLNETNTHVVCYVKSFDNFFIELVETQKI